MWSSTKLDKELSIVSAQIEDLESQREENVRKGNWNVVKAIKLELVELRKKEKLFSTILHEE